VEEIVPVFSHALILQAGRRLAAGKKQTVLNSRQLSRAFGAPIELRKVKGRYTLFVAPKADGVI
jgi:iron complex transport system ATP-binding protein